MLVATVVRIDCCFCERIAPKSHRRSFFMGPPTVASYVGTVLFVFRVSDGVAARSVDSNGVNERQLSLANDVRNDPLKMLPPDLVMTLATPPSKRPYSADTPAVETVVS